MPTVVDLFSGCGGFSCGFTEAGWTPVCAVDTNANALQTYKENFPDAEAVHGSVCDNDVVERILRHKGVDAVVGGPPCQGFSSRNTRKDKNPKYGEMNNLPFVFANLAVGLCPKLIIMEEVPCAVHVLPGVTDILQKAGYNVSYSIVDSSLYGVPQKRKRLILLANKETVTFSKLQELPIVSVREAFLQHPVPVWGKAVSEKTERRIVELGEKGLRSGQFQVVNWDKPCRTIHTLTFSCTGPYTLKRGDTYYEMSIEETARLQSFPSWFSFVGYNTYIRRQLGNAVPPALIRCIVNSIRLG